jgi:hypothetical protein
MVQLQFMAAHKLTENIQEAAECYKKFNDS